MFKPRRDYSVKKDRSALRRRLKYVLFGLIAFLLGFALSGLVMGLFR